jgi:hypothetical protein
MWFTNDLLPAADIVIPPPLFAIAGVLGHT